MLIKIKFLCAYNISARLPAELNILKNKNCKNADDYKSKNGKIPLFVHPSSKTISNIKKIQTALDMYYLDNGVYPENIYPDIATGSTIYLSTPFNQSEPLMCPEAEEYDYKVGVTKKDYSLIYCLEKEIENTPSGINIASPSILSNRIKNKVVYKDCKQDNNISTSTIEDMKIQEEKISTTSAEKIDSDQDGLLDIEELFYKTDPNNPDTDGDGYIDGDEVRGGYNPNGDGLLI